MGKQLEVPDHIAVRFFVDMLKGVPTSSVHYTECPICNDHKKRMYLLKKERNWIVYCHNCEFSSSLLNFVKHEYPHYYDKMVEESLDGFLFFDANNKKNKKNKKDKKEDIENTISGLLKNVKTNAKENNEVLKYIKTNCVPLIHNCGLKELQKEIDIQRYELKQRLLSDNFIDKLYYAFEGEYKQRVIIPFYDSQKVPYFFQAKATQPWQMKNKYINWKITNEENKPLYNEHFVDISKTVFIVEGLIDSLFLKNSVATTGASLSKLKIRQLKKKYPNRIWVLDNDKTGLWKTKQLLNLGETCVIFPPEYNKVKDINDLALLIKKEDLTDIIKQYSFSDIEGIVELSRR